MVSKKLELLRSCALGATALLLAACQSGGSGTALSEASGSAASQPAQAVEGQVLQSDLMGFCPQVQLREGTAYFNTYERGGEGDSSRIIYQASITDVTRSCNRANGQLNMTAAVAGRVISGPKGGAGTVSMPIRIAVVQGDQVLYSKVFQHQTAMDGSGAKQFVFTDTGISIPIPSNRNVAIFAGFDEEATKTTSR
ncbi:hypothetical protein [Limoniibacter endophyticus]|uniref:Lipoprotein n=1 Tax=Limoniibacter endophyticus TaxID=1565040 RepID=A0A8J3GHF1_9HYPH|nr:hypothetical protein [Limoniibacter endophyticus]GHC71585.1 hypothetical protein GCM10010136_18920 [Limoniibacter endophyticus]